VLTFVSVIGSSFRLPLFHVGALNPLTTCMYRGATVILLRQFDAEQIWDVLRDEQVTTTLAVPAMLNFMLATFRPQRHQPLQLQWILSGAAPVPRR
jgi:acyl-CoA synthetase (AMP-forming)/AMP-acid ligase II